MEINEWQEIQNRINEHWETIIGLEDYQLLEQQEILLKDLGLINE